MGSGASFSHGLALWDDIQMILPPVLHKMIVPYKTILALTKTASMRANELTVIMNSPRMACNAALPEMCLIKLPYSSRQDGCWRVMSSLVVRSGRRQVCASSETAQCPPLPISWVVEGIRMLTEYVSLVARS